MRELKIDRRCFFSLYCIAIHREHQTRYAAENNTIGCASAHRRGNICFLSDGLLDILEILS